MRTRYSWSDLIPVEETKLAASYLVETWSKLVAAEPKRSKYSNHEPRLTESLHVFLKLYEGTSGLTGFWTNESQEPRFVGNEIKRIKTDIKYQSNVSGRQLDLVFEFKKLTKSNLSNYRGEHGMRRFVDGHYAKKQPLAVMVGVIKKGNSKVKDSLIKSLSMRGSKNDLRMVHDLNGKYIVKPSVALYEIAEFDTEHSRPQEYASQTGTTTVAHLFLVTSG